MGRITEDDRWNYDLQADNEFDKGLALLPAAMRKVLDTNDNREAYGELRVAELAADAAERKADARVPA